VGHQSHLKEARLLAQILSPRADLLHFLLFAPEDRYAAFKILLKLNNSTAFPGCAITCEFSCSHSEKFSLVAIQEGVKFFELPVGNAGLYHLDSANFILLARQP
jgi:hypothetical protein